MTSRDRKLIQRRIDSLLQVGCHAEPDDWLWGNERLRAERRARMVEAQALKRELGKPPVPCKQCGRDVREETHLAEAGPSGRLGPLCFGCGLECA